MILRLNRELSFNVIQSICTSFLAQALLIVSGILTARILGPTGRGEFALLTIIPLITAQIGMLGMPQGITHFVAKNPQMVSAIWNKLKVKYSIHTALVTATSLILLYLISILTSHSYMNYSYVIIIVTPSLFLYHFGLSFIQGLQKFNVFNICRIISTLLFSTLILLLYTCNIDKLSYLIFSWAAVQLLTGVIVLILAYKLIVNQKDQKKMNQLILHFYALG